jgi:hypothetical protein
MFEFAAAVGAAFVTVAIAVIDHPHTTTIVGGVILAVVAVTSVIP